jgi:hypothetical protein
MLTLLDNVTERLTEDWRPRDARIHGRNFRCRCGVQVFFRNSLCLACRAPLGYEPGIRQVRALDPGPADRTWRISGEDPAQLFRRCGNFESAAGCNWLVPADEPDPCCIACRLNHTVADLSDEDNRRYWRAIELAKRRLVSQLLALGLPVKSKVHEDPQRGLMFDFLRSPPGGPRVLTGHASGLITLNVEEADDARREKIRHELHEPYRTLLGHFRHEVGHYYWDRLIRDTPWLERFRDLFGDERASYAKALRKNYNEGPPADWRDRFISSYASTHPWEDWAESWAHYLHVVDSLDTALDFGFSGENVTSEVEPYALEDLYAPGDPGAPRALALINSWLDLMTVLNELARSMGQPDFYPFVMSRPVMKKLHFIHLVVRDAR